MNPKLYVLKSTIESAKPYLLMRADEKLAEDKNYQLVKEIADWADALDLDPIDIFKSVFKDKKEKKVDEEKPKVSDKVIETEKTDAKDADEKTDDKNEKTSDGSGNELNLETLTVEELKDFIKSKGGKVHHNAKLETALEIAKELLGKE